jgi:hypothetical protein
MMFPDISNHPTSEISGKPVLGSSVGTNDILLTLRDLAGKSTRRNFSTFMVNIYTLLRNCFVPKGTYEELVTAVANDMDILFQYFQAYANYRAPTKILVVFYAPNYGRIPPKFLRDKLPPQRQVMDDLYTILWKSLPEKPHVVVDTPMVRRLVVRCGKTIYPHAELAKMLRDDLKMPEVNGDKCLISHCPIDYHLSGKLNNIFVIESYTGNLLSKSDFGKKLGRLEDGYSPPFTPVTHQIFGDSVHLKPLVSGTKKKTELLERAKAEKWAIKLDKEIAASAAKVIQGTTVLELLGSKL